MSLVWVTCDPETMHTYLRRRGAAREAAQLAAWVDYLGRMDLSIGSTREHVVIDNPTSAEPLTIHAERLLAALSERGAR